MKLSRRFRNIWKDGIPNLILHFLYLFIQYESNFYLFLFFCIYLLDMNPKFHLFLFVGCESKFHLSLFIWYESKFNMSLFVGYESKFCLALSIIGYKSKFYLSLFLLFLLLWFCVFFYLYSLTFPSLIVLCRLLSLFPWWFSFVSSFSSLFPW